MLSSWALVSSLRGRCQVHSSEQFQCVCVNAPLETGISAFPLPSLGCWSSPASQPELGLSCPPPPRAEGEGAAPSPLPASPPLSCCPCLPQPTFVCTALSFVPCADSIRCWMLSVFALKWGDG